MVEEGSISPFRWHLHKRLPLITGLLAVAFVFVFLLFVVQWYLINELFRFAVDLVKEQLLQEAPDEVEASEITKTFEGVEHAVTNMPMSYITGKINLKKAKAAADYAVKARADGTWASEEINTLLNMMNAAVGFKREEK